MTLTRRLVVLASITLPSLTAAAAELSVSYPNATDGRLQETVERLCAQAADGDRVTIHIAAGEYLEQVSTTIGCKKQVSWHFAGAGLNRTVMVSRGIVSDFGGVENPDGYVFSGMLACGASTPWTKPNGDDVCANHFPPGVPLLLCRLASRDDDDQPRPFAPFSTSCEVSDLSFRADDARTPTAVVAAWSRLIVRRVAVDGFPHVNIGCNNCRDVDIEHARVRCLPPGGPSGGRIGVAVVASNDTWPIATGQTSSGNRIRRVDVQGCANGIVGQRQTGLVLTDNHVGDGGLGVILQGASDVTLSHNRVVRSAIGMALFNVHASAISFNHLADNVVGLRFMPSFATGAQPAQGFAAPSSGNAVEHNLDFGNGQFLVDSDSGVNFTEEATVSPEAYPQGW